ncbi:hypothetical protein [Hydrogenimonas sp.]
MRHFGLNLFLALLLAAGIAVAGDSSRHQNVNGLSIYLGVIPAQLIRGHEKMHGGAPGEESYHILVAVFDAKSGERLKDAKVAATVSSVGMRGVKKSLEPMRGELLSYGNYFLLERPGRYGIEVEIYRKGAKTPVVADFFFLKDEE